MDTRTNCTRADVINRVNMECILVGTWWVSAILKGCFVVYLRKWIQTEIVLEFVVISEDTVSAGIDECDGSVFVTVNGCCR